MAAVGTVSGAALAAAVALRVSPVSEEARLEAREEVRRAAVLELELQAARLPRLAERLQALPVVAEIVDGGGADVRPSRLFEALSDALPDEPGWGALFVDAAGRPAAWAGDAGPAPLAVGSGPFVDFQVTRFRLGHVSPRVSGREARGTFVVSRVFPTGILRPDLADALGVGGASSRTRVRARAATEPGRLVALGTEPAPAVVEAEDVARRRALPASLLAAAGLLALAFLARPAAAGVVAARLVLVASAPRAEDGPWGPIGTGLPAGAEALAGTPADLFLTGIALLLAVRLLHVGRREAGRERLLAGVAAAVCAALVPALTVLAAVWSVEPLTGPGLVPRDLSEALLGAGVAATGAALLLLSARLFAAAGAPGGPLAAAAGAVLAVGAPFLGPGPGTAVCFAAAGLLGAGVASGLRAARDAGWVDRLGSALFVVASVAILLGAGQSLGAGRRQEALLEAAADDPLAGLDRPMEEDVSRWEERLADERLRPWLPAGERTLAADVARALWVRGADARFPGPGDLLTVRSPAGNVVSSFGLLRPGAEARGEALPVELPLAGLAGVLTRVRGADRAEQEPLLAAAVAQDIPASEIVTRSEYDAAGRPLGPDAGRGEELPHELLVEARRTGTAKGFLDSAERTDLVLTRSRGAGFRAVAVPARRPLSHLVAGVAACESALPFLLPIVVASGPRRAENGRRRLSARLLRPTFRGRLVALLLLAGALPMAGGVVALRGVLEAHAGAETRRRALAILEEARRALGAGGEVPPDEFSLNRAAAVVGTDLLLYREGLLVAASRAVPVAGGLAGERLSAGVAVQLADGRTAVAARAEEAASRGLPAIEGALLLSRSPAVALAVVVPEDEAVRNAVDGLVLFAVAGVLAAVVLGSRAALALSRPVDDVVLAADRLGSGLPSPPLPRPEAPDLARLVDAFEAMSSRVQERTALLAHEREAAVGLLANLTAAVLLFREGDGEVLLSNPQADRILPGASLPERLADPRWEPLASFVRSAQRSSEPRESRVAVSEPAGERVYRVVVAPLGSPEGRRAVLLLEDLTEFLRADRLGAWVDAARAVAHDVKNPLTPIRLSAERLLRQAIRSREEAPGAVDAAAKTILRQVSILTERIGRLGRFSDPAVVSLRPMDGAAVRGLLDEVAGDFAHHEGVRWAVEVEEGLPPIRADRDLLRDALTNFALNAVEALSEGGGTVRLSAASAPSSGGGRSVTVSCEDDGPGVPEPLLVSLFDPSFSTKARGSGMGLAAARRVVERQGGTVFARSRDGGGLCIGFVFAAG